MTAFTYNEMEQRTTSKPRRPYNWRWWSAKFSFLAVSVATFVPGLCFAEGFRNSPAGAFNLGRAGGRITQVDDSSAVNENPANMMDLQRPEAQYTPSIIYFHVNYTSPGGEKEETKKPWKPLVNFFAAMPLENSRWAAGVGITIPYGLANEWKTDGAFADPAGLRYTAPFFSQLITINLNPAIAARLNDRLSIGAGLDFMWTELSFRQYFPWFLFSPGAPEGRAQLRGSGIGYGANIGITWEPVDHHRIALTYRTPMDANLEGHMNIDNVPAAAAGMGASSRSDLDSKIKFPATLNLGYGVEFTDKIRAEVSGEWVQFSRFDSLKLNAYNNNVLIGGGSPLTVREDWRDTFTVGIGGDWKFLPNWVARAGFRYYQTPVPDSTFSPSIPDANQKVFTFGLGYSHGHHTLEGAYGLDFYDQRVIASNTANPSYNGTYDLRVHLFSLSYKYQF